jgi:hypothetical protein
MTSTSGKSGTVTSTGVTGVCWPLVSSLTLGVKLLVADPSALHEICLATHALEQGLGKGAVAPFVLFDRFLAAG